MLTSRIRNTASSDGKSFSFTFAYHNYFSVSDIWLAAQQVQCSPLRISLLLFKLLIVLLWQRGARGRVGDARLPG